MASRSKSATRSPRPAAAGLRVPSLRMPTCNDDPEAWLVRNGTVCVLPVSKDLRHGLLRPGRPGTATTHCRQFELPERRGCTTMRTVHQLQFQIVPHRECDSAISVALQTDQRTGAGPQGQLLISPLVTRFDGSGLGRGIHAGNFLWRGPNFLRIRGRASGTTNAGLRRAPVFDDVERCTEAHVLYGRLCGRVETIDAPMLSQLVRAQFIGTYRIVIHADPRSGEAGLLRARAEGVFEGAFVPACI